MNIITIDPGLSGGIAIYQDGAITTHRMPTCPAPQGRKGNRIDSHGLSKILRPLATDPSRSYQVVIEHQQAFSGQGVASTFKTGLGYGLLLGTLIALGFEVLEVSPRKWKQILPKEERSDKQFTIALVGKVWPEVSLVPKGCRVPHDGIADALGMLLWARKAVD